MAHVTGTATNFKDAFDKLRNFFLNQSAFGATPQPWQEMRYIEDNVETCSTNMTVMADKCIEDMFKIDPRTFFIISMGIIMQYTPSNFNIRMMILLGQLQQQWQD